MMDLEFIADENGQDIRLLTSEIAMLQEKIQQLKGRIETIQQNCRHIFLETPVMRTCQKCGFSESTYY